MKKLIIVVLLSLLSFTAFAIEGRNQGAVNNLCQNLQAGCQGGDQASCEAFANTGCMCDESQGTCSRGNYSN